jgi:hypothetical protein
MTPGYVTNMVSSYFKEDCPIERNDLIKNDSYALFKTFDNVYQQFKEKVDLNSYFCSLLNEIE